MIELMSHHSNERKGVHRDLFEACDILLELSYSQLVLLHVFFQSNVQLFDGLHLLYQLFV